MLFIPGFPSLIFLFRQLSFLLVFLLRGLFTVHVFLLVENL